MTGEEAAATVVDALNTVQIPYMLVGSFSSNFYGIPRATQDADFVVQCEQGFVATVAAHLAPVFRFDPQMAFETVTATTRYVARLVDGAFDVDFFLLSEDPHDIERFARRRTVTMLGRRVFLPTAEDVIITKLRWSDQSARAKDVNDVRGVIAVQGDRVQWDYVRAWCDRHGTRDALDEIRRALPPA